MERDLSQIDGAAARPAARAAVAHRQFKPLLIAGIVLWGALSFYAALVVATQIDVHLNLTNRIPSLPVVNKLPFVDEDCTGDQATEDERINILVMGLDLRRDEDPDQAARTDTVFVMTMEPCVKTAGILSVPRDLAVEIPDGYGGYFLDRINTAYVYGERREKGIGPQVAVETFEHNFNIPIDYYAVLNFNNFIEIVDELGGVDVDVPEYVWDPEYSDCNSCGSWYVEFEEGLQHMDGETALTYARLRHSDNDFKRIERQQLVMRAIARKASDLGWLTKGDALSLYGKYKDAVKTDIGDLELAGLALLGKNVGVDNVRFESLNDAVYPCPYAICGPAAMLLAIPEKVEEIKARIFNDGRIQSENALIKVVNGTPTPKFGEDFATYLRSQGVPSERLTVDELADGKLYNSTMIIDHQGKKYTADKVASWLGFGADRILKYDDLPVELHALFADDLVGITVVLGADAVLPELPAYEVEYDYPADNYYYEEPVDDTTDDFVPEELPPVEETPPPDPEPTPEPPPEPTPEPPPEPTPDPGPGQGQGPPGQP